MVCKICAGAVHFHKGREELQEEAPAGCTPLHRSKRIISYRPSVIVPGFDLRGKVSEPVVLEEVGITHQRIHHESGCCGRGSFFRPRGGATGVRGVPPVCRWLRLLRKGGVSHKTAGSSRPRYSHKGFFPFDAVRAGMEDLARADLYISPVIFRINLYFKAGLRQTPDLEQVGQPDGFDGAVKIGAMVVFCGIEAAGAVQNSFGQVCTVQIGHLEIRICNSGSSQTASFQIGAFQVCAIEICFLEVGLDQLAAPTKLVCFMLAPRKTAMDRLATPGLYSEQIGAFQIERPQVGREQVGHFQVCLSQVGAP